MGILESNKADIVFSTEPLYKEGLEIYNTQMCREILGVIVPKTSVFAKRKTVKMEEVKDQKFLRYRPLGSNPSEKGEQTSMITIADKILKEYGTDLNYVSTSDSSATINALLDSSDYWALCTDITWNQRNYTRRTFIPFSNPKARYYIYAAYKKENSKRVEPILSYIKDNYKKLFLNY